MIQHFQRRTNSIANCAFLLSAAGLGWCIFESSVTGQSRADSNYDPLGNSNSSLVGRSPSDSTTPAPSDLQNGGISSGPQSRGTKSDTNKDGERHGFTYGKRGEVAVRIDSSKPTAIQKTKFGGADTSEGTGVFKDSLLDSNLKIVRVGADGKPLPGASPKAQPSVAPKLNPNATPKPTESPHLNINLGVSPKPESILSPDISPAAGATASPRP